MCPFYAVSSIVLSCIFHNTSFSNKALISHHFLHQEHGMSHAHCHMYPSALSPRRINKAYYRPMPDAILVGFLTDMGIFSHPKSPHTKLQLPSYTPFQLRDSSNIGRLLLRTRQGSRSLIHIIRRSEKLVVLAGSISIC